MSALEILLHLVAGGKLPVADAAALLRAVETVARQAKAANELRPDMVAALLPAALPIVEDIAETLYPGADKAIAALAVVASLAHRMTPAEELAWMDRQ